MAKTIIEALLITLGLDDTAHKKGTESVTQDQAKIRREAQQTAKQLKQNGQEASEFFDGMIEKAVGFFAVIAGGRELLELGKGFLEAERAGSELAEILGVDVQQLQSWQHAIEREGGSVDSFNAGISHLNEQIAVVTSGSKLAERAMRQFSLFGLGEADVKGKSVFEVMEKLSGKMEKMSLGEAVGLGQRFGFDASVVRVLHQSGEERDALLEKMRSLGGYTAEEGERAKKLGQSWTDAKIRMEGVGMKILALLMPALEGMMKLLDRASEWAQKNPEIIEAAIIGIAAAVGILALALIPVVIELLPIELVVLAIAAAVGLLAAGVAYMALEWNKWINGGQSKFASLFRVILDGWNKIKDGVFVVIQAIQEYVGESIDSVIDMFSLFFALLTGSPEEVKKAWDQLVGDADKMSRTLRAILYIAMVATTTALQDLWAGMWINMEQQTKGSIGNILSIIDSSGILNALYQGSLQSARQRIIDGSNGADIPQGATGASSALPAPMAQRSPAASFGTPAGTHIGTVNFDIKSTDPKGAAKEVNDHWMQLVQHADGAYGGG